MTGLTFPGIIVDPAWTAGKLISVNPAFVNVTLVTGLALGVARQPAREPDLRCVAAYAQDPFLHPSEIEVVRLVAVGAPGLGGVKGVL